MKSIKRYWWISVFALATFLVLLLPILYPMPSGAYILREANNLVSHNTTFEYTLPSDFQSVEELKEFLSQDNTNNHIYLKANSSGVVRLDGVCNEEFMQLRDRAQEKGKYLGICIVSRLEYYKITHRIMDEGQYHTMAMAIIGREYYLIEPKTDEIWLAYRMP
jgi:hypothetical protein